MLVNESDDEQSAVQVVSPSQAYEALDTTIKWLESLGDTDPTNRYSCKNGGTGLLRREWNQ